MTTPPGGVAQLAEHYVRNVGVAGSNPVTSTAHQNPLRDSDTSLRVPVAGHDVIDWRRSVDSGDRDEPDRFGDSAVVSRSEVLPPRGP